MNLINWYAVLVSSLIPMVVGAVWYHPKVMGNAWMKASGTTQEQIEGSNMALIFGLAWLMSLFISALLIPMVIHQTHVFSTLLSEPGIRDKNSEIYKYLMTFMKNYGGNFRTFKHGALHGAISGVLFVTPIIATISLFERRGWRYILIHAGYWVLSLTLMGGLICGWTP